MIQKKSLKDAIQNPEIISVVRGLLPNVSKTQSGLMDKRLYPISLGLTGGDITDNGKNIIKIKFINNARICFLVSIVGNNSDNTLMYIYRNIEGICYKILAGYEGYTIKYKKETNESVFSIYIGTITSWGRVCAFPLSIDIDSIEAISTYDENLTNAIKM